MKTKKLTPCQSIKKYCKEQCCANDLKSWKNCTAVNCYLWPYRFGKRPTASDIEKQNEHEKRIATPSFFERNPLCKGGMEND